jgi:Fe2+ or Zn2+ uptake regulation protein
VEIGDFVLDRALRKRASSLGFRLEASVIEIKGTCARCAKES